MTEIVYYAAASLDGFIAGTHGQVDWLNKYLESGEEYGFEDFNASIQATLMGRFTFEKTLELNGSIGGERPCWVFSRQEICVGSRGKNSALKAVRFKLFSNGFLATKYSDRRIHF